MNFLKNRYFIGGMVLFVAILVLGIIPRIRISNHEITLRQQVKAQQDVYELNYDKMFKVIAQIAQLPKEAEKTFKNIYPELIKGRYDNDRGGALMSWITENNPQFDFSLYGRLADAIEGNRQEFFNEGKKLRDIQREHTTYVTTWPATMYIPGRDTIAIQLITSTQTEQVFKTGKEDNIDLFKDDTKK